MRRKYLSALWKCFLLVIVSLCCTGCGRQESAIPSGASESIQSESSAIDHTLYTIVLEEAQSYFAGDKTLEEVVDMIQRRASLYVAERQ